MKIKKTNLDGCFIVENKILRDSRGFFTEIYHKEKFDEIIGFPVNFVQDNFSFSTKGVLRGLHFQKKFPQGKLIRVLKGRVFDVVVDIRKNSKTFGSSFNVELSDTNNLQVWIPEGFAHGFLVLSDYACFEYKCTNFYIKEDEDSLYWKDPDLKIPWPKDIDIITSEKDEKSKSFKDYINS